MTKRDTYDTPSDVVADDGKVEVRGPDAVDVDLTPEAAEETSDRLLNAAMKARGDKRLEDFPHKAK
ncbi:MAG TPA: hypothetical protein VHN55_05350 [Sphingomicrobium sp.]|nr:hypothetical protein [Sphingomicrobium sp.]